MSIPKGYKFGKRKSPRPFTDEHRRKIGEAASILQKGKKMSESHKRNWIASRIGKKQSKETV